MEEEKLITLKQTPAAPPLKDASVEGLRPRASAAGRSRPFACLGFVALLTLAYAKALIHWAVYAMQSELHSYVLLVPFVSAYLVGVRWRRLPRDYASSFALALPLGVTAAAALGVWWRLASSGSPLRLNDSPSLVVVSFVLLVWAIGFAFLGARWMASVAFPAFFLLFMAPLPDAAVDRIERISVLASAEAAEGFFALAGVPALRNGVVFQLPDITIKIAQECSGIHSSLVLFISSLVAGQLFLRTPWRKAVVAACVIPLGILRNGFRILVIGWLCVHVSPEMIHSPIHHDGGPIFFALSLPFLLLLLWWLRRGERGGQSLGAAAGRAGGAGIAVD